MTLARPPPSPQAQAQQLTTVSQDKLNKIKRKLKETIEVLFFFFHHTHIMMTTNPA